MKRLLSILFLFFLKIKSSLKIIICNLIGYKKITINNNNDHSEIKDKLIPLLNYIEFSNSKNPFYSIVYSFVLFVFVATLLF